MVSGILGNAINDRLKERAMENVGTEDKIGIIVDAIDAIAVNRAREKVWDMLDRPEEAETSVENTLEAKHLLKGSLILLVEELTEKGKER